MVLCYKCKWAIQMFEEQVGLENIVLGYWCDRFEDFIDYGMGQHDVPCDGYEPLDANNSERASN